MSTCLVTGAMHNKMIIINDKYLDADRRFRKYSSQSTQLLCDCTEDLTDWGLGNTSTKKRRVH